MSLILQSVIFMQGPMVPTHFLPNPRAHMSKISEYTMLQCQQAMTRLHVTAPPNQQRSHVIGIVAEFSGADFHEAVIVRIPSKIHHPTRVLPSLRLLVEEVLPAVKFRKVMLGKVCTPWPHLTKNNETTTNFFKFCTVNVKRVRKYHTCTIQTRSWMGSSWNSRGAFQARCQASGIAPFIF